MSECVRVFSADRLCDDSIACLFGFREEIASHKEDFFRRKQQENADKPA